MFAVDVELAWEVEVFTPTCCRFGWWGWCGEAGAKGDTIEWKTTLLFSSSSPALLYSVYLRTELLWGSAGHSYSLLGCNPLLHNFSNSFLCSTLNLIFNPSSRVLLKFPTDDGSFPICSMIVDLYIFVSITLWSI